MYIIVHPYTEKKTVPFRLNETKTKTKDPKPVLEHKADGLLLVQWVFVLVQ